MKMSPYVDYWKDILLHLSKRLHVQGSILLESFWPCSNWKLNYARAKLLSTTQLLIQMIQSFILIVGLRT